MLHDSSDHSRLLLGIEEQIKKINKEVIDPMIPKLKMDDLLPVIRLVASIRGAYLKELFDISAVEGDAVPSHDQIKRLRDMRVAYEEFQGGVQAMQTAIERGYLDVEES
jgi:hypothetical protein